MKKYIILFLLVLPVLRAVSQNHQPETRHEFSIGYGWKAASSFEHLNTGFQFHTNSDGIDAFFASYNYRFTRVIGVGVTYTFDPRICTFTDPRNPEAGAICKTYQSSNSIVPFLKVDWLNRRVVTLYSKVGVGISLWRNKVINYYPDEYEISPMPNFECGFAYQLVPIGIEIGSKQYAGFLQYGLLGMEGAISIGFRYGLKTESK